MLEILYLHQSSKFKIYMTFFSADNLDLIVESIGTTWRQKKKTLDPGFQKAVFPLTMMIWVQFMINMLLFY